MCSNINKKQEPVMRTRILDTTLRDGSYVINFQFTAADTQRIGSELESVGFDMIEVGHGVGLGASENGGGIAAETDIAYMEAAAEGIKKADWGMFCIPGIASVEHIDIAADHGMKFIRVGTDVTRAKDAQPFIERAKKHGMNVAANFMKSYVLEPSEFADYAKQAENYGADIVYVVDSAGGMLPKELEAYVKAVQDVSAVPIGYHGHNNLGLAVANSLVAMDNDVAIIDASLQGFGRSAGNTSTEQFLAAVERGGMETGFDIVEVMNISEKYIKPLIQKRGVDSLEVVSGLAQFHSSYMSTISKFASKYNVDPRRLIIEVCKEDMVAAPEDLVERKAKELSNNEDVYTARFHFERYHGKEQTSE
jgi:4-hydroxy-2-oxovalerate aldolase